ncbi:hypothetical protein AGMMS49921_06390 [Endomicrobiia bacterium]|nr:hypothetical protein AGMMS49921_06390 [Endomicrobiia bacterium]
MFKIIMDNVREGGGKNSSYPDVFPDAITHEKAEYYRNNYNTETIR